MSEDVQFANKGFVGRMQGRKHAHCGLATQTGPGLRDAELLKQPLVFEQQKTIQR